MKIFSIMLTAPLLLASNNLPAHGSHAETSSHLLHHAALYLMLAIVVYTLSRLLRNHYKQFARKHRES